MAIHKFKDNIYRNTIYLVYAEPDKKIAKYLKSKFSYELENIDDNAACVIEPNSDNFFIIIRDSKDFIDSLVHECLHVTAKVMRFHDIQLTKETEEAYTYYMEWLFSECYKRSKHIIEKAK